MTRLRISLVLLLTLLAGSVLLPGPEGHDRRDRDRRRGSPAQNVDLTYSVDPGSTISVENIAGSVEVSGWGRNEVRITGTLGRGTRELEVDEDPGRLEIEVDLEEDRDVDGSDLVLKIPYGSRLRVDTVSAEIVVNDFDGEMDLTSVSGEIEVEARSSNVRMSTVSGRIELLNDGPIKDGAFKSVTGTIDIDTDVTGDSRLKLESVSGKIILHLPESASASFDVETFSGEITSELGGRVRRKGDYLPAKELRFASGGGAARIAIETLSGTIRLARR